MPSPDRPGLYILPMAAANPKSYSNTRTQSSSSFSQTRFQSRKEEKQPLPSQQADTPFVSLLSGAVARGTQIFVTYPIDTIKTRIQLPTTFPKTSNPTASFLQTFHPTSLYHGLPATMAGQIPYGMLVFGIYETVKTFLHKTCHQPRQISVAIAALTGDFIGSVWLTPSEVIKSLVQARRYSNVSHCIKGVLQGEHGIRGFYRGYSGLLLRDVPFRMVQMGLYEEIRNGMLKFVGRELKNEENLGVGLLASTLSAAVTTPLDVLKTRMMTQGDKKLYRNVVDCVFKTFRTEGPSALFKGILPRVILIGCSGAVFFAAYEACKAFLRRYERRIRGEFVNRHQKRPLVGNVMCYGVAKQMKSLMAMAKGSRRDCAHAAFCQNPSGVRNGNVTMLGRWPKIYVT